MAKDKPTYEELEKRLKELEDSFNRNLWLTNTRLQLALNSANIGIHEWKIDTNEFIWDSRIYEFWGLPNGTPITMELFQKGIHPDDLERVQKQIEPLFDKNSDGKYFIQYRVVGIETNIERWLEFSGQMHYENGKAKYFFGTAIDISEKKQQAQALVQANEKALSSEDNFRLMVANSPDAIIIQDENGAATFISPQLKDIFGHEPNDYLGKSIPIQSIYPEDLEKCKNAFNALQSGSELIDIEYRFYKLNGEIVWVQHTARPTFFNGRFTGIQNNIRDISKRKNAEEALSISKLRYQTFFEQSHDGIVVIDPATTSFLEFNDQTCKQLGYSREEFAKLKIFDIEVQETAEQSVERIKNVLKNGKEEFETQQRTKQGEIRDVNVIAQIIKIGDKRIYHCIWRDITDLKRYEKELIKAKEKAEESELLVKTIFQKTNVPKFLLDSNGHFIDVNQAAIDFYGYTLEQFLSMNVTDINQTSPEIIKTEIQKSFVDNKYLYYRKHKKANGDLVDVEVYTSAIQLKDQKIIQSIIIDISERQTLYSELLKAKEKAEESEKNLKESQAIARLGAWELDIDSAVFTFTDNLLKIYHTTAEEIGGYQISINEYATRFVHPDDASMVEKEVLKALETDNPNFSNYVEHRIKYFDGGIGYIGVKYFIKKDETGRTIKTFGVNQDITEKKLIEQELIAAKEKAEEGEKALKHSHDLMQYIIEHNRSAIAVHDKNFKYIYVSQRYLQEYQVKEKDIIGKHHYDVFPDLPQKWRDVHKKALAGEVSSAEDDPYYKDDGTVVWTRWECRPWYENDKSIGGFIVYTEVITERKNMELDLKTAKEKAEESDKLKTAFLLNMSHEIKTPLNSIIGFSDLLNKPELSDEKRKSFTSIIINSSHQLESIVNNILTISVLETKQERLNIQPVCVNSIIVELLSEFKPQAYSHNISIIAKQQLSDKLSEIYTDGTKVTQILTNLISNALKYTHQGSIEFGYDLKGSEVEFFVKDTGIGIDPSLQEKIFERFVQAEMGIVRQYGGNGLGLSISKGYVELLGGKIWLESELGKGSAFYFTIPYKPNPVAVKQQCVNHHNSSVTTILVAEDEEINYLFIEELLIEMDVILIHAKDGQEALDLCKANPNISLVLMDIKMPIMDGYTATIRIKEIRPELVIIAQSAYSLEQYNAKYNENPFDDYVSKPIRKNILEQKLLKYIDKH